MTCNRIRMQFLLVISAIAVSVNGWSEPLKPVAVPLKQESANLAVIAGKTITLDMFREEMVRRQVESAAEKKEELLDSIVRSELLFAAARSAGYENDPEVIRSVKQIMVDKYLRDNLEPKLNGLKASDQETENYYQAHKSKFGTSAMVHSALIQIAVSPKMSAEKKADQLKLAESARVEALALESGVPAFGGVALKYSDDQASRYRGGDVGWLQGGTIDGRWDKKVSDAIFALKAPGQVSPVVAAPDGYYLVKLMGTKAAVVKPLSEVEDGVRYLVIQEKKKQLESAFIEQLKSKTPVTVNSGLLQKIVAPVKDKPMKPPVLPGR